MNPPAGDGTPPTATPEQVPARAPSARGAGVTLNVELAAWAAVLAIAAGWRLIRLDAVPPATMEGVRGQAVWQFAHRAATSAWPGDLTAALAAQMIRAGGDGIGWVRLPAALFGLAAVGVLWLVRPYAGRAVTLLAALLLACSPIAVASARSLSPDAAGLLWGLVLVWLVLRVGESGDRRALPALATLGALALTNGAVAVAFALVILCGIAVEIVWLDRAEVAARWRAALGGRLQLVAAAPMSLLILLLGVLRFGAGPDRLSLAALADWARPPADMAPVLPWHAPLLVEVAYEPLVAVLGVAGAVILLNRWRRHGAAALTPFQRLLLVWAGGGLLLALAALHHRPGQMLVLGLPLMLLAAEATVTVLSGLPLLDWRRGGPALSAAAVIVTYLGLRALTWANEGTIPRPSAGGATMLAIVCAGLVVFAVSLSPAGGRAAMLVAAVWLLLGPVAVHGAAAAALRNGNEIMVGQRALPQRLALVTGIEAALAKGQQVAVERGVAAALAWELRGRDVHVYTGLPPRADVVVAGPVPPSGPGGAGTGAAVAVEERWYPEDWDTVGVVRWLAFRQSWGPAARVTGALQQGETGEERAPNAQP